MQTLLTVVGESPRRFIALEIKVYVRARTRAGELACVFAAGRSVLVRARELKA